MTSTSQRTLLQAIAGLPATARAALLILVPTLLAVVWLGLGVASLPGLALLLLFLLLLFLVVLPRVPEVLLVVGPALMPMQQVWIIFPYEALFGVFFLFFVARLLRDRATWALPLSGIEVANLALVTWALFTGFWCTDPTLYFLGARRFVIGWVTLWVAYRMARLVRREWFEAGLIACSLSLTLSALTHRFSLGLSSQELLTNRAQATDLGWGTANFIATLLLILIPPILVRALRGGHVWEKLMGWTAVVAAAVLQVMIASRAATVLFFVGGFVQLAWSRLQRRAVAVVAWTAVVTALMFTPVGQQFISRFSNPRDLGSIVIRLWYWRDAWRRTMDNLPWGIGVNHGEIYRDHLADIDPHNYWLVLSSELGIPGVLLWVIVLVLIWRGLRAMGHTPGWQAQARALKVAFWLSQLHTLVEPTFQGAQYQYLYFWLFGGYLGYHATSVTPAQASPRGARDRSRTSG